jgi:hypothetical protein
MFMALEKLGPRGAAHGIRQNCDCVRDDVLAECRERSFRPRLEQHPPSWADVSGRIQSTLDT